jgi:hypothetical protein
MSKKKIALEKLCAFHPAHPMTTIRLRRHPAPAVSIPSPKTPTGDRKLHPATSSTARPLLPSLELGHISATAWKIQPATCKICL